MSKSLESTRVQPYRRMSAKKIKRELSNRNDIEGEQRLEKMEQKLEESKEYSSEAERSPDESELAFIEGKQQTAPNTKNRTQRVQTISELKEKFRKKREERKKGFNYYVTPHEELKLDFIEGDQQTPSNGKYFRKTADLKESMCFKREEINNQSTLKNILNYLSISNFPNKGEMSSFRNPKDDLSSIYEKIYEREKESNGNLWTLTLDDLSDDEKRNLRSACIEKCNLLHKINIDRMSLEEISEIFHKDLRYYLKRLREELKIEK